MVRWREVHEAEPTASTQPPAVRIEASDRPQSPSRHDRALFLAQLEGVSPLAPRHQRVELQLPRPRPEPRQRDQDEAAALRESLLAPLSPDDRLEIDESDAFIRPGVPRRVLSDLRRGRWTLQGELDLHGLNREQARKVLSGFLHDNLQRGRRCVRIIHGKGLGSPGREPVLKKLSRHWLSQREEILAYCEAKPQDGGGGALVVLLRAPRRG